MSIAQLIRIMTHDLLISREKVMAILDVKSTAKFNKLRMDGAIPPAVGQFKRTHLWSNAIVQEFNRTADRKRVGSSRDLVETLCCEGLIRLADNGTFNVNSNDLQDDPADSLKGLTKRDLYI